MNTMTPAISAAIGGLDQAARLLNQTASRLAESPQDQVSLSDEAVSLLQAKNSYQANLNSIKVADEMQKSTLNLLA
jgi:flagellar hook protein FlgE